MLPVQMSALDCAAAQVPIVRGSDVDVARRVVKAFAAGAGFWGIDLTLIATAVTELARNIVDYAGRGEIVVRHLSGGGRLGIVIVARDDGPGIHDIDLALSDGGLNTMRLRPGLLGSRRLMDDFEISSATGGGTTVTLKKWIRDDSGA